jgi:hypothetical protein
LVKGSIPWGFVIGFGLVAMVVLLLIPRLFSSALRTSRSPAILRVFPEAKAAEECVGVISSTATGRQVFQFLGVASPENHIIGMESVNESGHTVLYIALPRFLAKALHAPNAEVVFVSSLFVGKVAKFHRHDNASIDKGGTQTGPKTQEEHQSTLVAP